MADNQRPKEHNQRPRHESEIADHGSRRGGLIEVFTSAYATLRRWSEEAREARVLFTVVVGLILLVVAGEWLPIGPDYFYTFRPVAHDLLTGDTVLYDESGHGYYGAPWGLMLILPTLTLPVRYGQAVLTVVTLVALAMAARAFTEAKSYVVVLAMANLHTFDVICRGNVDGFVLLGIGLAVLGVRRREPWLLATGFWFMSVKPVNVMLPLLTILWLIREWDWREKVISASPVAVSLVASILILGWWPRRYVEYLGQSPPKSYLQTTIWRLVDYLGLSPWWAGVAAALVVVVFLIDSRQKETIESAVASALSAGLVVSPYALGSHYVLLAPVFVLLSSEKAWCAVSWVLTLTPLARLAWGWDVAWLDLAYPLFLFVCSVATPGALRLGPVDLATDLMGEQD